MKKREVREREEKVIADGRGRVAMQGILMDQVGYFVEVLSGGILVADLVLETSVKKHWKKNSKIS